MNKEVFLIKNITASDVELKDFGLIISSGSTIELQNFDKAILSNELDYYLSGNTLVRVVDGNIVDYANAYSNAIPNYYDNVLNELYVAKSGATYDTIQSAINSITDASSENPYFISVGSGIYTEDIIMKNYVYIQGIASSVVKVIGNLTMSGETLGFVKLKDIQFTTTNRPTCILDKNTNVSFSDVIFESFWDIDNDIKCVIDISDGTLDIKGKTYLYLVNSEILSVNNNSFTFYVHGSNDINILTNGSTILNYTYNDSNYMGCLYNNNTNTATIIKIENSIVRYNFNGLSPNNFVYNVYHSGSTSATLINNSSFECVSLNSSTLNFITVYNKESVDYSSISLLSGNISWNTNIDDENIFIGAAITINDNINVLNTVFNSFSSTLPTTYIIDGNSGFTYYSIFNGDGTFYENNRLLTNTLLIGSDNSNYIDTVLNVLSGDSASALITEHGINQFVQNGENVISHVNTGWTGTQQNVKGFLDKLSNNVELITGTGYAHPLLLSKSGTLELTVLAGNGYIAYENFFDEIRWDNTIFDVTEYEPNLWNVYITTGSTIILTTDLLSNYTHIYLGFFVLNSGAAGIGTVNSSKRRIDSFVTRVHDFLSRLGGFVYDNSGLATTIGSGSGTTAMQLKLPEINVQSTLDSVTLQEILSTDVGTKFFNWYYSPSGWGGDFDSQFNHNGIINYISYNNPNLPNYTLLTGGTFTFTNGSTSVTTSIDFSAEVKVGDFVYLSGDTDLNMIRVDSILGTTITLSNTYLGSSDTGIAVVNKSLVDIPNGKYVKHLVIRDFNANIGLANMIYGTQLFDSYDDAEKGSLPDTHGLESSIKVCAIIVTPDMTTLQGNLIDLRPLPFSYTTSGGGGAGVTVHGNLSGLNADDHLQYLKTDGTRNITDVISYNNNKTFTSDTNLISKKYADDNLALKSDSGHTHNIINNDLIITGDLTVSGTTTFINTEDLNVFDNMIYINSGETGTGVTKGFAGIEIDRGQSTNYRFLFDETGETFKIGQIGDLLPVATREDTPTDGNLAIWNATSFRFDTTIDPNSFSLTGHTHEISDINDLQSTLDSKSDTGHTHLVSDIDNISTYYYSKSETISLLSGYTLIGHSHVVSSITDINTYYYTKTNINNILNGYTITGHTHTANEISDLSSYTGLTNYYQSTLIDSLLNGKMNTGETIAWNDINFSGSTLADIENRNAIDININVPEWSSTNVDDFNQKVAHYIEDTQISGRLEPEVVLIQTDINELYIVGGSGYIIYDGFHKLISWSGDTIDTNDYIIPDNIGTYYVYIDTDGIIHLSTTETDNIHFIRLGSFYWAAQIGSIRQDGCVINNSLSRTSEYFKRLGIFIYDNGGNIQLLSGDTTLIVSSACKIQMGLTTVNLQEVGTTESDVTGLTTMINYITPDQGVGLDFSYINKAVYLNNYSIPTNVYNDITKNSFVIITGGTFTFTQYSTIVTCDSNVTNQFPSDDFFKIYAYEDGYTTSYINEVLATGITWTGSQTIISLDSPYLGTGGIDLTCIANFSMVKIPSGKWVKSLILRTAQGQLSFYLAQAYYESKEDAINAGLPAKIAPFDTTTINMAYIVYSGGTTSFSDSIYDIRPLPFHYRIGGQTGSGGGSITKHSSLSGLDSDDHLQYLKTDGTRNITGIQKYNSHPTFTSNTDLIDKKYVDDNLLLKANSAHTHTSTDISNLTSYNGFTSYYLKTNIDSFFSGTTSISGYNKTNWDSAYTNTHTHTNKTYLDAVGNNTIYHVGNINTNSINLTTDRLIIHTQIGASSIISGGDNGNNSLYLDSTGGTFEINTYSSDNVYLATGGGNVAIGNPIFDVLNPERFLVQSYTESKNIISAYADADTYIQLNIHNSSNGNYASSDIVATADNGSETDMYVDLGINSSTYNDPSYSIVDGDDSYLIANGGHLAIGTSTPTKILKFFTNGTTAADEKMRIDSTGNIIMQKNLTLSGITLLGNETITGTLKVTGATNLNSTLTINGATIINNTLTANSSNILGNETVTGTLKVTGATNLNSTLTINGATVINNTLTANSSSILGNETITGTLKVTGATNLYNTLTINGATIINNTLTANSINVSGNETVTGTLKVTGATNLYNTLTVNGVTIISNSLTANSSNILGNEAVIGTLKVTGSTNLYNNLGISGSTFLSGITGIVQSTYTYNTPAPTAIPTTNTTYYYITVTGTDGPDLTNLAYWTINWNLTNNGLYTFSFNTNDGIPSYYVDLLPNTTQTFNQTSPALTFTGVGIANFNGDYWVNKIGGDFVLVSKTGGFAIYLSNTPSTYVPPSYSGYTLLSIDNNKKIINTKIQPTIYGSQFNYAQDLTQTTTTSVTPTYSTKLTITTGVLPIGLYKITGSYGMNKNITSSDILSRIRVDGTMLGNVHNHELSDTTTWLYTTRTMFITFSTTVTHTITLEFSQEATGTLNIRDCSLEIFRVS
jgi:hypothetical protein